MLSPRLLAAAAAALLASSCSLIPGGEKAPAPIRLRVDPAARLNPDDGGESLPTALRVYQLSSSARASNVEMLDLLRDPKEALGDTVLATEELLLEPGVRVERTLAREKGAQALLVAGVFRRPTGQGWRQIVELPPGPAELAFAVEEYRVERR
jgi:type VI secretion system protein VasD